MQLFESVDNCDNIDNKHHPVSNEFLKALLHSSFVQSTIKLKVGVFVILFQNISVSKSLYNGTRLIVTRLHQNNIKAYTIRVTFNSRDYVIFRIKFATKKSEISSTLTRKQFLIRLSFAITINKS